MCIFSTYLFLITLEDFLDGNNTQLKQKEVIFKVFVQTFSGVANEQEEIQLSTS